MEIHLRVERENKNMNLMHALHKEFIKFNGESISTVGNTDLHISTLLFDDFDEEIFEGDILCDSKNEKYRVIYRFGAFFAVKQTRTFSDSIEMFPLYLLQENGHVPAKIVK